MRYLQASGGHAKILFVYLRVYAGTAAKRCIGANRLKIFGLANGIDLLFIFRRECRAMKEAYEKLEMEVITFDSEDVITTSYWGEEDPIE